MPEVVCPYCSLPIPPEDVNVGEGVAYCRQCAELTRLRDLLGLDDQAEPAPAWRQEPLTEASLVPPPGCSVEDEVGERVWRVSTASVSNALWACLASAIAIGVTLFGALVAYAAAYAPGGAPAWIPAFIAGLMPITRLWVVFIWIGVAIGAVISVYCVVLVGVLLFGSCEARLDATTLRLRTGVAIACTETTIDRDSVVGVRYATIDEDGDAVGGHVLVMRVYGEGVQFASLPPEERKRWLARALRAEFGEG
jgi:hypothetical protein